MRFEQYETPKLSLGAVALVAAIIPILLGYFLVTGFANNPAYTGLGAGPSTTSTSGTSSIIKVSMPAGAGNPSGAPGFAPDKITVVIGVNASVLWENNDTVAHTVTSVTGNGSISSGNMNPAAVFLYNFTTPGTYDYVCAYHPWMTGTVVVVGSSSATTPSIVQVSIPVGAGNPSGAPGYAPDILNVTTGTTVVWTNNDNGIDHTVTSVSGNGSLNSGNMDPGAKYNYTFTSPGTYDYICVYHSWMKGVVVVKAGAGSTNSTGSSGSSAGVKVSIPSGAGNPSGAPGYSPDKIKVVIGVNNSVTWTNDDTAGAGTAHTVTSVSGNGSINSGNMPAGATYTYVFTTPGTYNYYCTYHSWMTGTVVVVAGSSSGSTSTNTSSSSGSTSSSSGSSSSSSTTTTSSSSSSSSGASLAAIKVSIPDGAGNPSGAPGYSPDKITVVIGVNNTVTWTNNDATTDHTVTSTSVPTGASMFNSQNMDPGATFSYTFTTPGTYQYDCTYHSWMTGTIVVIQG